MQKKRKVVLNFSSTDNGGAGSAAFNFHKATRSLYDSYFFTARKTRKDAKSFQLLDKFKFKLLSKLIQYMVRLNFYKLDYYFLNFPYMNKKIDIKKIKKFIKEKKIDSIIIHSVPNFLNFKLIYQLKKIFNCKIYFNLYDMQHFTGGCSYSLGCKQFRFHCDNCEGTNFSIIKKEVKNNLLEKIKYVKKIQPKIISSSKFEKLRSENSILFKNCDHFHIPQGHDKETFYIIKDKKFLKKKYNINENNIIFFGAADTDTYRKGLEFFLRALKINKAIKTTVLTIGHKKNELFKDYEINNFHFDFVNNFKKLNELINVCDFTAIPSIDETGPTMYNISMMSGVPCITFDIGDSFEYTKNGITGYKSKLFDFKDMSKNIKKYYKLSDEKKNQMRINCRNLALNKFSKSAQKEKLKKLFN
tara:strand:- start:2486 stop:3733 length:1248 start_codon:yes stop_codon:yes gene_type:complete